MAQEKLEIKTQLKLEVISGNDRDASKMSLMYISIIDQQ
jgi:hypothetical protein